MTLPSRGVMKASMIRSELRVTGKFDINASNYRTLAKRASGRIRFSDFYGKRRTVVISTPADSGLKQPKPQAFMRASRRSMDGQVVPANLVIAYYSRPFTVAGHTFTMTVVARGPAYFLTKVTVVPPDLGSTLHFRTGITVDLTGGNGVYTANYQIMSNPRYKFGAGTGAGNVYVSSSP